MRVYYNLPKNIWQKLYKKVIHNISKIFKKTTEKSKKFFHIFNFYLGFLGLFWYSRKYMYKSPDT